MVVNIDGNLTICTCARRGFYTRTLTARTRARAQRVLFAAEITPNCLAHASPMPRPCLCDTMETKKPHEVTSWGEYCLFIRYLSAAKMAAACASLMPAARKAARRGSAAGAGSFAPLRPLTGATAAGATARAALRALHSHNQW